MPSYYLEVQNPHDVQAAFRFSKKTGVKLVIKNSGHDHLSRSSQKGALALWTRKLQSLSYNPAFAPSGCGKNGTAYNAITTGAGVNFDEVYAFADAHNVTFIGGYSSTVGVSGGWVQAGGHSVLSPVYGLGIDRVIEFESMTPDGKYRTANACKNTDLFWALRGGGGGTFGVVMESTHIVEPPSPLRRGLDLLPQNQHQHAPLPGHRREQFPKTEHGGMGRPHHRKQLHQRDSAPLPV